jgi:hypothetical protein
VLVAAACSASITSSRCRDTDTDADGDGDGDGDVVRVLLADTRRVSCVGDATRPLLLASVYGGVVAHFLV